jgi:hypothetical protein
MDIRLKFDEKYLVRRIGWVVQRSREVDRNIRPERGVLWLGQDLKKFPVPLFAKSFPEAEIFHLRK